MKRVLLSVLCIGFIAKDSLAYDRPETFCDDVGLAIRGLEEPYEPSNRWIRVARFDVSRPLPFTVAVTNAGRSAVTGVLQVKMNADWSVAGGAERTVSLPSGEGRTFEFHATARQTAVGGLYPVHATFHREQGASPAVVAVIQAKGTHKPTWNHTLTETPVAADEIGLLDREISVSIGDRSFSWRGMRCRVDGLRPDVVRVEKRRLEDGAEETVHFMRHPKYGEIPLRVRLTRQRDGILRLAWDMPGVVRAADGTPRYTHLSLGPGDEAAFRVYAGLGNVMENPKKFRLSCVATHAGTRFTGCDYSGGFSCLQATDVYLDCVLCDQNAKLLSQVAHGDATFTLLPSAKGAFAAARHYSDICGYEKSPGHDALLGRMCLDTWGGAYDITAEELEAAAKYGLTDSVFVKHVWQRYGYDYRLPDICPPAGDEVAFMRMVRNAQSHGIWFCPHDNYTDIYPDCDGFNYDLVRYRANGTPQTAWLNPGRNALSYKWLDHAILPAVRRNASQMARAFAPDGVFIDVLASQPPVDHYDRQGRYCDKSCSVRSWNAAFDIYRQCLGKPTAAMISETGHDALVGHVDAGQADHERGEVWFKPDECTVFEKTPWQDMVTHNRMILYAGGLGSRYSMLGGKKPGNEAHHGYASDDYLGFTALAGRMPMCEGPFSRSCVMTYWLLHDLCACLGKATFEEQAFADGSIRRQQTRFSNGARVWMNRDATNEWVVAGQTLPPFGFVATAPNLEAGIVRKQGCRVAYAKAPGKWFVDARPRPRNVGRIFVAATRTVGFHPDGATSGQIAISWTDYRKNANTSLYGYAAGWDAETGYRINSIGHVSVSRTGIEVRLPKDVKPGVYDIHYGLVNNSQPDHPVLPVESEDVYGHYKRDGLQQVSAGAVRVDGKGGLLEWLPPSVQNAEQERLLEVNTERVMVDFGGVVTDGAFRLLAGRDANDSREVRLIPLPGSGPFKVRLDLAAFGRASMTVREVQGAAWRQEGHVLSLEADGTAFEYRIK